MMDVDTKRKVQGRLKRIAGQVGGLQRMVDADRYCVDVLLQIAAARAALGKVGKIMLASHVQTCVTDTFEGDDSADQQTKIEELIEVFDRHCNT